MPLYGLNDAQTLKALAEGNVRVALYGMGKMGLPLAACLAQVGCRVTGVDVSDATVNAINAGKNPIAGEAGLDELVARNVKDGRLSATTNPKDVDGFDVFIILVPTHVKPNVAGDSFEANLSIVHTTTQWAGQALRKGGIVITECTMPPGQTNALIPVLEKESGLKAGRDFGVAHAPERTMSGTAVRDIQGQYPKVLGTLDDATYAPLNAIYSLMNSKGVIRAATITTAECVKVFEGTYRDVNIALANELARFAMKNGVDAFEAFRIANTVPYYHLHQPGIGVGGHCIPYYPYFVMSPDTPLIKAARRTNDAMPVFAVDQLERALSQQKPAIQLRGAKIAVLGLAFRGGVKEFAHSPGLAVVAELKNRGADVHAFEPLCTDEEVKKFGVTPLRSLSGMHGAILAADHAEFKTLDWNAQLQSMAAPVLIEGRPLLSDAVRSDKRFTVRTIGRG